MLNYIFKRYKDTYTLQNAGSVSLTYSIALQFCGEDTVIQTGSTSVGATTTFNLIKDGKYVIAITGGSETNLVTVYYYNNLILNIVKEVKNVVCGCQCNGCDGDCDNCEDSLNLINKILGYSYLTKPQYTVYLDAIATFMQCELDDTLLCLLSREKIIGEVNIERLSKKLISLYYLAFYYGDLSSAADQEEKDYINARFDSAKILPCLRKEGIDIQRLEDILSTMGTFTINSGIIPNRRPSSVGNNTINVLNRATTVLTLAMFTTDTTPPYADPENDPVLNLRVNSISGSNTGIFYYLGSPITVGTVIPAVDITSGLLTHMSPNQDGLATDSFTFSLSDTGSGIYTP